MEYIYNHWFVCFTADSLHCFFMGHAAHRETFERRQDKSKRKKCVSRCDVDAEEWSPCYTGLWSGEACVAVTVTQSAAVSLLRRRPVYSLSSRLAVSFSVSSAVMVCGP